MLCEKIGKILIKVPAYFVVVAENLATVYNRNLYRAKSD